MEQRGNNLIEVGGLLGHTHKVEATLGEGAFGFVAKCRNINTNQTVAIKVNKPHPDVFRQARREIDNLKALRWFKPEASHIIHWQGFFFHGPNICLAFELLDLSLYDYMRDRERQRQGPGLPVPEVRAVLTQMSSALCFLGSIGMAHADIKPDNIMVVDRNEEPIRVKLIDFGLSLPVAKCEPGYRVGTTYYMAPEMCLWMRYTEAIDMWSLGLTAVEMIMGSPMYPANTEYDLLRLIVETQGQPEDHVLDQGEATKYFFNPQTDGPRRWKLKTPEEYDEEYGEECSEEPRVDYRDYIFETLDDLESILDEERGPHRDHGLLVDLIKKMLFLDHTKRIRPIGVLQHPFICESLPQSSRRAEDQQPSEDQPADSGEEDLRIQTGNRSQPGDPENTDFSIQSGHTSQAEEPQEGDIMIPRENPPQSEDRDMGIVRETPPEPEDTDIRIVTETPSEPEDTDIRIVRETPPEPEDTDIRIVRETPPHSEEPEEEDNRVQRETTPQAEGPEDQRGPDEEIQPERRAKKGGMFRRFVKFMRNVFRIPRRPRGRSRSPLETAV